MMLGSYGHYRVIVFGQQHIGADSHLDLGHLMVNKEEASGLLTKPRLKPGSFGLWDEYCYHCATSCLPEVGDSTSTSLLPE